MYHQLQIKGKHMSLSVIVDGKILYFRYKKMQVHDGYNFYIDTILIGQIFKMRKGEWTAVSGYRPYEFGVIEGFRSRYHASILSPIVFRTL